MDKVYVVSWYEMGGVGAHFSRSFNDDKAAADAFALGKRKLPWVYNVAVEHVTREYYNHVRPYGEPDV